MTTRYDACTGTGHRAVNPHTVNVNGLGSKFAHMRGKHYGECPQCGRTGLVLIRDHWLRETTPDRIPRHKATAHADQS